VIKLLYVEVMLFSKFGININFTLDQVFLFEIYYFALCIKNFIVKSY